MGIITSITGNCETYNFSTKIPAYFAAGKGLNIWESAIKNFRYKTGDWSEKYNSLKAEDFEFCGMAFDISKGVNKNYFMLKSDKSLWEYIVIGGTDDEYAYSFLTPCLSDTYYCYCRECKEKYIINWSESDWYKRKGMNPPTGRCKNCRIKAKEKRQTV